MGRKLSWAAKQLKEMGDWVDRQQPGLVHPAIREALEGEVDLSEISRMVRASTSLEALAGREGTIGCVKVGRGDAEGWCHLQASTLASAWHLALYAHLYCIGHLTNGFTVQMETGRTLALAIALHEDTVARWLGGLLVDGMNGPAPFADWRFYPFAPFITRLYARWRGLEIAAPAISSTGIYQGDLGIYKGVFDQWEAGGGLVGVCDYHVKQTDQRRSLPEFIDTPIRVFPAEILALRRVRADLGLATPPIQHRLLESPLAEVPDPLPAMTQPYHLRLREKAEAFLASLPGRP